MSKTTKEFVSIWTGSAASEEELDESLTLSYAADGNAIPCPFGVAYGKDWFDDDFREISVQDKPTRLIRNLLSRHSTGTQIAESVIRVLANSFQKRRMQLY